MSDKTKLDLNNPFESMEFEKVLEYFNTSENGLTDEEVVNRTQIYGYNSLREKKKDSILKTFFKQFTDLLIIILIFAAIISAILPNEEGHREYTDAALITVILIINAIMGVYQEWRADKAIEALKRMVAHNSRVIRNGKEIIVPSADLVPGDIIVLEQGDRVPADARLIFTLSMRTEEAQLTGESNEINKFAKSKVQEGSPIADFKNSVFMGTHITFGKGKAVVTKTGMFTEMGKIAEDVQEINKDPTPTQVRLEDFGKKLTIIILALMVLMVFYGVYIADRSLSSMFIIAVSLAVAAIPEGLPIVVTLALALGVQRMAKQHAIVKKLTAVESLGSVTTICTDKTGTLTLNQMTVKKIVTFDKNEIMIKNPEDLDINNLNHPTQMMFKSAILCNNSILEDDNYFGDPTELALLRISNKLGYDLNEVKKRYSRVDEIPFDSERKRMTIMADNGKIKSSFTKGAPDVILNFAESIDLGNGEPIPLTDEIKQQLQTTIDDLADQALRVLVFGYYELKSSTYNIYEFEKKLIICGFMGMIDPPKEGVKMAVDSCKTAGINVKMVTGDHRKTAIAIAKDIGIYTNGDMVLDGIELDKLSNAELTEIIDEVTIFARISPQHKLRIVQALKARGEIVAMTGDGVNDAPALKGSDIGIAMGSGTDVTKETADMVLEDDNFTTIVSAVEQGRGIYDNMTKFIKYMLSSNTAEIVVIFVGIMLGFAPPLIAVQILWINLVTDGVPALALGVDPTAKGVMNRAPRDPKESLIAAERVNHIIFFGFWMSVVTLGSFVLFMATDIFGTQSMAENDRLVLSRTIAFSILSMSQFIHAVNVREDTESILGRNFFRNKVLVITVFISMIVQFFIVQGDIIIRSLTGADFDFFNPLFKITYLDLWQWIWVVVCSLSLLVYAEFLKYIKRNTKYKTIF
jgi:P-type Ca2+ transporter type 2C